MTFRPALPRLFLAALLWLAVLLATTTAPPRPLDLLLQAGTVLAVSALLLDLAVRRRAHGLYGLIALAGLYGLVAVVLFEPSASANELPRLLVSRGLGAQTLAGLLMLTLWLTVLSGRQRAALGAAFGAGALGSIWSHVSAQTPELIMTVVLAVGLYWVTARTMPDLKPANLALSWRGQGLAALVLLAMGAYRLSTGALDTLTLAIAVILIAFVVALLWFQRSKRAVSLLEMALPPTPPRLLFLLVPVAQIAGALLGAALVSTSQLRDGLDAVVTAFGIVWLPAMSFAIGAKAMLRQVRAQQL